MGFSRCCCIRRAIVLLTVAILVRICWRCVISGGRSLRYRYKFLAVFESCMYILGVSGGRVSIPNIMESSSAVLMLVSFAPILLGR